MLQHAIVRRPGANVHEGLTTADLGTPDLRLMLEQHAAYVRALESCGAAVTVLEPDARYPDGCFVEDVAVVTPDCIVITRPGAPSRRGEETAIAPVLARYGRLEHIEAPGTVEGGDVIVAGDRVLVGLSERTNAEGARQLEAILSAYGMRVATVAVTGALHLKTGVNYLADNRLLMTRAYEARAELAGFTQIVVPSGEEYSANVLCLGDRVLVPDGFPGTRGRLEDAGFSIVALELSEFRKMDGGLTCLSIRL